MCGFLSPWLSSWILCHRDSTPGCFCCQTWFSLFLSASFSSNDICPTLQNIFISVSYPIFFIHVHEHHEQMPPSTTWITPHPHTCSIFEKRDSKLSLNCSFFPKCCTKRAYFSKKDGGHHCNLVTLTKADLMVYVGPISLLSIPCIYPSSPFPASIPPFHSVHLSLLSIPCI